MSTEHSFYDNRQNISFIKQVQYDDHVSLDPKLGRT